DIQHLLLPGDLIEIRVLRRVELDVGGIALVAGSSLVLDVKFQAFAVRRSKYPILRIQGWPRAAARSARSGALHRVGGRQQVDAEWSRRVRRILGQSADY